MKKGIIILLVTMSLLVLAGVLFHVKVGWILWGREDMDPKRMGYSFDVATDSTASRLFVVAGIRGLHILNLNRGKLEYVATYYDGGYYRNLKVRGDRAFIADAYRGLLVLDISRGMPLTTWVQSDSKAYGVYVEEDKVYVAAGEEGLEILDISVPDSPVLLSTVKTSGEAWDVWVHNGFAYVADLDKGVTVIDVHSPGEPRQVGFVTWAERNPSAEIVRGEGNIVCIAAGNNGLIVIDVSNPTHPVVASRYRPLRMGWAEGLAIRNGLVYLAMGSDIANLSTIENGLHILDVSNPSIPRLLSKLNFVDWVEGVLVTGEFAYVANTNTGIRSISVHDPARPYLVDTFNDFP